MERRGKLCAPRSRRGSLKEGSRDERGGERRAAEERDTRINSQDASFPLTGKSREARYQASLGKDGDGDGAVVRELIERLYGRNPRVVAGYSRSERGSEGARERGSEGDEEARNQRLSDKINFCVGSRNT